MRTVLLLLLLGALGHPRAQTPERQTENLILVTLDGVRWQEVFGGADSVLLRRRHPGFSAAAGPAGSLAAAARRRQALLPFLWGPVARAGQLYGNRAYGNYVTVTNKQRLSYAGYNELLTGRAADPLIRSNADHGRGRSSWGRWAHHSRVLAGSDQIWLAVLGPDTPPTGEQQAPTQLYQNQLATTLAALLGLHYGPDKPLGAPIRAVWAPAEGLPAPVATAPSALGLGGR